MNIDIDAIVEQLAPWELTFRIKGSEYQTRPPLLGEVLALGEAKDMGPVKQVLAKLFVAPAPPLDELTGDELGAIAVAIGQYAGERSKKNGPAMASRIEKAMSGSTPGRP
jgi:hypothetical protein